MPAFALADCLEDLASLVDRITDHEYLARSAGAAPDTIGAHVRHCLDHVDALLDRAAAGPSAGPLTYESPVRRTVGSAEMSPRADPACGTGDVGASTWIEHSRLAAVAALHRAAERVRVMAPRTADTPLTIEMPLARLGVRAHVRSSLGRELVFVLQHAMHHRAGIARLLAQPGSSRVAVMRPHAAAAGSDATALDEAVTRSWRAS